MKKLSLITNLIVWQVAASLGYAEGRRGPHHPRGEAASKHRHHTPQNVAITRDSQLLHDTQHLAEDSMVLTPEALAAMTPEELEFHYFSSHDFDSNQKLDGLELLKAVFHTMEHHDEEDDKPFDVIVNDIESYVKLVDKTLTSDDTDGDGFVSYAEYRAVRLKQKEQAKANKRLGNDSNYHRVDENGDRNNNIDGTLTPEVLLT